MEKFKRLDFIVSFIITLLLPEIICLNLSTSAETRNATFGFSCNLNVIPLQYEISLGPVQNSSVSGWAKIKVEISDTDCNTNGADNLTIKLNTRNCKIDLTNVSAIKLVNKEHTQLNILGQTLEENFTQEIPASSLSLQFNERVEVGDQLILYVPYQIQVIRDDYEVPLQGFYYYVPQNVNISNFKAEFPYYTSYMAEVQQFAFRSPFMFPAFDYFNPVRKATFKISVARDTGNGFVSFSNSAILKSVQISEMEQGWVMDHFEETPPMPVDQVTLMLLGGGFQNYTVHSAKNCTLNLWTRKDGILGRNYSNSAVNTVKEIGKVMDFFENTFNQSEFSLSKIDFIAVPWFTGGLDLHSNYGIVASNTDWILLEEDPNEDNSARVHSFLRTQLALQWFRGMVTSGIPAEEDDVWITGKGLASYVGGWPTLEPKFCAEPSTQLFWGNKGIFLLEMLENLFSRAVMETAIAKIYLPKVLQDGAFPQVVFDSVQKAIELHNATHILPQRDSETVTVTEISEQWLNKKYHWPTIRITQVTNDTSSIALYQEYLGPLDAVTQLWWIPVNILTGKGNLVFWLSPNHNSLNSSLQVSSVDKIDTENEWLFMNPGSGGYYRSQYSDKLFQHVIKQLNVDHSVFPAVGRRYLLFNQYSLVKDFRWESLKHEMEMLRYLDNEMDFQVWDDAIGQLGYFHRELFKGFPNSFGNYFGNKMNKVLEKIGIHPKSGENIRIFKLRQTFLKLCSTYEIPLCAEYATNLITEWMENKTTGNLIREKFDREIRGSLYCAAVGNGNSSVFHFMLDQHVNIVTSRDLGEDEHWDQSENTCKALACATDEDLLESVLSNKSKLAGMEYKGIGNCYGKYIPETILQRRPVTMTQAVFDFFKRETLNGNIIPESIVMDLMFDLTMNKNVPPKFLDWMLEFLEDRERNGFVSENLIENVKTVKNSIANEPKAYEEFWRNGTGGKMVKWFEENN